MGQQNEQIDAAERAQVFSDLYGNELDAAHTLADIVIAAGNYLTQILGEEAVAPGMARMLAVAGGESVDSNADLADWRAQVDGDRSSCYSDWPLGQRLHNLAAYALYGILLEGSENESERADELAARIAEATGFLEATPVKQWQLDARAESDLIRLVRLAKGRWALDNELPIDPAALADLGGVTEGRVRNLMAGESRIFSADNGLIPASEALAWLAGRKEFWNSIWRRQEVPHYHSRRNSLEQAIFVPVARDGSLFHPGLRRGGGYTVGEKGAEQQFANFDDALQALQHMPVPYWRRPNVIGNWGIVSGVEWRRLDARDLEALAAPGSRLLTRGRHSRSTTASARGL